MITVQHIIQKVSLTLDCDSDENLHQIQARYVDTLQKKVLPELEKFFDEWSKDNEVLKIDKIDINLGALHPKTSIKDMAENMLAQIKKAVQQELNNAGEKKNSSKISLPKAKLAAILFFLKKGHLPKIAVPIQLEADFLFLLNEKTDEVIDGIERAFEEVGEVVFRRMSLQFSFETLEKFFHKGIVEKQRNWIAEIQKILFLELEQEHSIQVRKIWEHLLKMSFSNNQKRSSAQLIKFLNQEKITVKKTMDTVQAILEKELAIKEEPEAKTNEKEKSPEEPDFFYGKNVGIILLHPFLNSFFQEFKLLNEQGNFKNERTKEKAIGLLNFIATGKMEAEEFDLSFQKIISGIPMGYPIPSFFEISASEKQETEKMLKAVVKYWSGLGNTSIDGLREGFLQRVGKIQQDEQTIFIQVERRTMDILLDKIPWNISMVKLPWLKRMIRVDWA